MGLTGLVSQLGTPVVGTPPILTTGNVYFVGSAVAGSSNGNTGTDPVHPWKTLAYALTKVTANQGDHIILMEKHAETITSALLGGVSGITIYGLGNDDARPTFTINAAIRGLRQTGTDCTIFNVKFVTGSSATAATNLVYVNGNNVRFIKCMFRTTVGVYNAIRIDGGIDVVFKDCSTRQAITAYAQTRKPQSFAVVRGGHIIVDGCDHRDLPDTTQKAMHLMKSVWTCAGTGSVTFYGFRSLSRSTSIKARSAGVSPAITCVDCRCMSTSTNVAVGAAIQTTYATIVNSSAFAQVNKRMTTWPAATES